MHALIEPLTLFLVYLGMILGGLPFLQLDRTGVALLGAIALIGNGSLSVDAALHCIDASTLILLFSFMVISAQMRLGGFYETVIAWLEQRPWPADALLALVIVCVALMSAIFSNDVVCLALTRPLIELCQRRQIPPKTMLWALSCAANIGSAASLIGNPQNMLIGQSLHLDFARYTLSALPSVSLSLLLLWLMLRPALRHAVPGGVVVTDRPQAHLGWQSIKGLIVIVALMAALLGTRDHREHWALIGAGLLLTSRHLHSRRMLALVDWNLILLFIGLFIVNHTLQSSGLSGAVLDRLNAWGWSSHSVWGLTGLCVVLSSTISNVPAVMLLLPEATHAGPLLAMASTYSGNALLIGSIANLIVAESARQQGITLTAREHLRIGLPLAAFSLLSMIFFNSGPLH